jgi:D-glycero-alpha-D-manno-heptose 1-phosphate guanylyltransferase
MEAIVLAGGLGTRLRPVVSGMPKPMAPVNGRPFLCLLLEQLQGAGVRAVVLSVGYKGSVIVDYFGPRYGDLEIRYAIEEQPLGTGGALRKGLGLSAGEPVWVLNGDSFLDLDFEAMRREHSAAGGRAMTMAIHHVDDASRYGSLTLAGTRIVAMQAAGARGGGLINAGVYLLSRNIFAGCGARPTFSFEADFLPSAIKRLPINAFITNGRFVDIGVPEDYERAQRMFTAVSTSRNSARARSPQAGQTQFSVHRQNG